MQTKVKSSKLKTKSSKPEAVKGKTAIKKVKVMTVVKKIKTEAMEAVVKTVKGSLKVDVFDTKGKVKEIINLPKEIFDVKVNDQLIAQAVRVHLANQRKGTVSTKTRGEVKGSSKKIYKQKGTGRARHGSKRAPIFVHGGLVFGPKPRDYSLAFPKKMKRRALFSALTLKLKNKEIKVISGLEKIEPKTKQIANILNNLGLEEKKLNILLVLPKKTENVSRAARNIKGVNLLLASQLNTYEVLRNKNLLLMQDSIDILSKIFIENK